MTNSGNALTAESEDPLTISSRSHSPLRMSASCTAVAFIDEFGNTDLDLSKEGPTSHFIICAIIVDDTSKVPGLSAHLEPVAK